MKVETEGKEESFKTLEDLSSGDICSIVGHSGLWIVDDSMCCTRLSDGFAEEMSCDCIVFEYVPVRVKKSGEVVFTRKDDHNAV